MAETLNEIERRVFGVLLEKALAQPQYYPMTLNAIVAACNQKSNRDPVMNLDEQTVWDTLEVLRAAGLISRLLPGGASRVERFRHEAKEQLGWEKPQRAVMAELLVRGPQTLGELRTRCARMYPFENLESVTGVLDGLMHAAPPRVAVLARASGQSAIRYAHTLYPPDEWAALTGGQPAQSAPAGPPSLNVPTAARATPSPAAQVVGSGRELAALRGGMDELRAQVAALQAAVSELQRRLDERDSAPQMPPTG